MALISKNNKKIFAWENNAYPPADPYTQLKKNSNINGTRVIADNHKYQCPLLFELSQS